MNLMAKILLVEDDMAIAVTVKQWLESEHHNVDHANTGNSALDYLKVFEYDLLILDRQLPGVSGIELCKSYKLKANAPVLMLTGMNSIEDKVDGLEAGADDYLTKPFDTRELMARIKALLRRNSGTKEETMSAAGVTINTASRIVTKDGKELTLTPREFEVLEYFFRHPNQVIGPEAFLKRVWHSDSDASQRAVYSCINRLRKNIDPNNKEALIKTVHGVGYRLEL